MTSITGFRIPRVLLIILALAVALRIGYLLIAGHTLSLQASGYDVYATNMLSGQGYTRYADRTADSDLPPLYPFLLAGIYTILGRSPISVAIVQIGFDVITLIAIYAIGRRVGGERVGLLAAAFTGFYPYLLFQNLSTNDTAVFIMLLTLGVWGAYTAVDRRAWKWAAFCGLIFGLGALTKSLVILMLPLFALWWWRQMGFQNAVKYTLALGITFGAVLLPWIIRNTQLHGTLTFISTNDGSNLYQGNNPCVADYFFNGWDAQWVNCLEPTPEGLSEIAEANWFRDQAIRYLLDHPADIPRLMLAKFITLWSPELLPRTVPPDAALDDPAVLQYEQPLFQAARVVHLLYFTPLLILSLVGLWRGFRTHQLTGMYAPLLIVITGITVAYLIYHPSTRYRSPADPFVFVLSAVAVDYWWMKLRNPAKNTGGVPT
ncbi:MAG: glycosyl transferase family protein [Chloroflexi bacterium OLB15]|nr:MAG: glycosyl transferase family protein [Chloroflexi bacterium OLB15]